MEYHVNVQFLQITCTYSVFVTKTLDPLQFLLSRNYFYHVQMSILIRNFICTFTRFFPLHILHSIQSIMNLFRSPFRNRATPFRNRATQILFLNIFFIFSFLFLCFYWLFWFQFWFYLFMLDLIFINLSVLFFATTRH